jgi:hypothetical protein
MGTFSQTDRRRIAMGPFAHRLRAIGIKQDNMLIVVTENEGSD